MTTESHDVVMLGVESIGEQVAQIVTTDPGGAAVGYLAAPRRPGFAAPGPDATELAGWVAERRQRLLGLVADLDDDQLVGPMWPTINPLDWEIGHVGWFQERFVLRNTLGEPPIIAHADALWDSGDVPHDTRWFLRLPARADIVAYLHDTAEHVIARLQDSQARDTQTTDTLLYTVRYVTHHEDWHSEAIIYTRQALGLPVPSLPAPPSPVSAVSSKVTASSATMPTETSEVTAPAVLVRAEPGERAEQVSRASGGHSSSANPAPRSTPVPEWSGALPGDVQVPGGRFLLGAEKSAPFVFDNEKWAHVVELEPFELARAPVSQSELADFADDGGYRRRHLWSDEGWAWREDVGAEHPLYWRRGAGGWERRWFDRWVRLEPNRPAVHVNFFEAEAWCRWTRRRLPTEAEWEAAAIGTLGPDGRLAAERRRWPWGEESPDAERANLDGWRLDTLDVAACPSGDSAFGARQLVGNVWEWTATVFDPYPGFERDMYMANSEPWFGSRRVLRGGCWATRSDLVRPTLRNYFTPDRRDCFTGLRTVRLR